MSQAGAAMNNTNALAAEKSPYLRQHAHNPVNWLPWGPAAFEKARTEDKPIFLSIGYSTCHWCHVMAHESFEDNAVAEVLNREFVPVKVDREERPDVDRIYMLFVQASTGSGGWPMSVWLTPSLRPFFGGTYFPPDTRYGRPGFKDLLQHLARAWKQDREQIETSGLNVLEQLQSMSSASKSGVELNPQLFDSAYWQFRRMFDSTWGGFGGAPKFPRPVVLNYLLRYHQASGNAEALEMTVHTLRAMAAGGMHDQLGGGFHRYSVDERWFVPHFEKMLYDQAQLAVSYLEAHQITREQELATVAADIFEYVSRDMTERAGGFFSAEDADSPDPDDPSHSREGAFYVWRASEIDVALSESDASLVKSRFGVEPDGNVEQDPHAEFTGQNILYLANAEIDVPRAALDKLFDLRSKRPRPHLDSKILTSWNGLMISAFVKGFLVLGDAKYLEAAQHAAFFLVREMYDRQSGRIFRRFCDGEAAISGFLDDYAMFGTALLDLFEATGTATYLLHAIELARACKELFEDRDQGGFFSTATVSPDLVLRLKDDYDGAEPSGNSVATEFLLRLAHVTGETSFQTSAERSLRAFAGKLKSQPTAAPQMAVALGRFLAEPHHVIVRCAEIEPDVRDLLQKERASFSPHKVVFALTDEASEQLSASAPFLASLDRKSRITIYECRNFVCDLPRVID